MQVAGSQVRLAAPGVGAAAIIAALATVLGHVAPIVGAPVFAIALGVVIAATIRLPGQLAPGLAIAGKQVLQISVVLLGCGLSLGRVARTGVSSLPVMVVSLAAALAVAFYVGRWMRIDADARTLIGVGTGICGASAIAATTSVIKARQEDVAYAIGTIFAFNVIAVLIFPPLGHLLGMDGHTFGLWAGTAVNDTSSVVAAAASFGDGASSYAVVVKLTRTLMIIPICLVLAWARQRHSDAERMRWYRLVPMFIVGFLAASALDTIGVIPDSWQQPIKDVSTFGITMALAGIGLGTRIEVIRRAGARPLLLGAVCWVAVMVTSLAMIALTT